MIKHILLFWGDYYGTLAATRCYGELGLTVTVADPRSIVPAKWSRFVAERVFSPPMNQPENLISWLIDFGKKRPGYFLYPSSDDLAFLFSFYLKELEKYFLLFQPNVEIIYTLLNKKRLHDTLCAMGINTPRSFFPEKESDFDALSLAPTGKYLFKPRTQILLESRAKGEMIEGIGTLKEKFNLFQQVNSYSKILRDFDQKARFPILQEYLVDAVDNIYSVAGFVGAREENHGFLFFQKSLSKTKKPRNRPLLSK